MKVFRSPYAAGRWAPGAIVAIGKFDGLHLGHERLIRLAVRRAKALVTKSLVVTFSPSPQEYFDPGSRQPLLEEPAFLERLSALGVDGVVFLPFNRRLACLAPEAFARDVLVKALGILEVCVGADFCFGRDRAGRFDSLKGYGRAMGFLARSVPILRVAGEKVSSSSIRRLLKAGKARKAERLLGRALPA